MMRSMRDRLAQYALERRADPKWKRRLYAIMYGASISMLAKIR